MMTDRGENEDLVGPRESLNFLDVETGLQASQTKACFEYVRKHVLPRSIDFEQLPSHHVRYLSKNSSIRDYVDELSVCFKTKEQNLILYSFGAHIQKALTIVEILKKSLSKGQEEGADGAYKQFNRLDRFVNVVPGRNELLEKKISIPILTIVLAHPGVVEDIKGFSRQSE